MQGPGIELALRVLVYLNVGQKYNHQVFRTEANFELYCSRAISLRELRISFSSPRLVHIIRINTKANPPWKPLILVHLYQHVFVGNHVEATWTPRLSLTIIIFSFFETYLVQITISSDDGNPKNVTHKKLECSPGDRRYMSGSRRWLRYASY